MRFTRLQLGVAIAIPYTTQAAQAPLRIPPHSDVDSSILDLRTLWDDLSIRPHANATGNFLFGGVNSLLLHWPNTRYRNGHNIVPGTIPVGTLLYHGRADANMPTMPDWTATDPEHSYHFCGEANWKDRPDAKGCWHLTIVATRPLRVLYLDGSSAANMKDGTLDAQDLLLWGKVDPSRWLDERTRIDNFCAWGRDYGIDGYLRMEMDFEVMLCDFKNGVELVSADYIAAWRARYITPPWGPPRPPDQDLRHCLSSENGTRSLEQHLLRFEMVRAGSWHNHYPGETRVVLDLAHLVSFYDLTLVPSLVAHRAGKARWDHRLQNISASDLVAVNARLKTALTSHSTEIGSGVDWRTLFRVLVDRYADRLEMLEYLLNTTTPANAHERATVIQRQLRVILTPYILYSARPLSDASTSDAWATPVWRACATRHTSHIHMQAATLTTSERLLLSALDETNREICRVVVRMWAAGVHAGLDALLLPHKVEDDSKLSAVVRGWRTDASALMAWLDWSVWVKCRPACGFEEMCYLPTWPYFWETLEDAEDENGEWKRPQPRCIRQLEPYSRL
ncbi:hypothetical protein MVEN_01411700 [Mycena venus]|uniref:Uncharacterized protein n=1 Tax=Mycena venus TaxID=2733690 RepID=A0A8H6XY59_9AGAR|nr:hypothetical protein MVEN_01411700 [Mycena venus]